MRQLRFPIDKRLLTNDRAYVASYSVEVIHSD